MSFETLYSQPTGHYHHLPPHSLVQPLSNARANSDTRNRISAPNSQPRHIKLVGLRKGGAQLVSQLDTSRWRHVQVVVPGDSTAAALASGKLPLLEDAEMIFIVACSGDDLSWAPLVRQVATSAGILTTGILVAPSLSSEADHQELRDLRANSDMLVIAADASYIADMLTELGA